MLDPLIVALCICGDRYLIYQEGAIFLEDEREQRLVEKRRA